MMSEKVIAELYRGLAARDHEAMARCYHREAHFSDPVFPSLHGWKVSAMWRMLCERGKDLQVEVGPIDGSSAHWEARYTFSQTGQKVHNRIDARFEFRDGLIVRHQDTFDLRAWMGMALGWKGKLLGWLTPVQAAVRKTAARGLEGYIAKHGLGPGDFANG